jgi:hypothetical protein
LQTRCLYKGNHFSIRALVLRDGACPVGDFLAALTPKERRKVDVLFEKLATHGIIRNKELFKKIEGTDLFEFKRFQTRLICFFTADKLVVICHAVMKKKDKHRMEDLDHATGLRKSYLGQDGK